MEGIFFSTPQAQAEIGKPTPVLLFLPWDTGIYDDLEPFSSIWVRNQSPTPVNYCTFYSRPQATEFANMLKVKFTSAEFSYLSSDLPSHTDLSLSAVFMYTSLLPQGYKLLEGKVYVCFTLSPSPSPKNV